MVVTFWPHPRTVLQKDARELRLLNSLQEKREILSAMGVDRVEVVDFTRDFRRLTAEEYLRDLVIGRLGGTAVVLGYDNRMGSDGLPHDAIVPLARSLGLDVFECSPIFGGGNLSGAVLPKEEISVAEAISSTRIRAALEGGEVGVAEAMLGYRYGLHGVVVAGNRLGRTIGYPTANMQLYEPLKLIPANGVYLVEAETTGMHLYGMTNIGVRPTVSGSGARTIETHIFDFNEYIYGLDLRLRFITSIRDERRFDSLDALKDQLAADERACRALIAK